MHNVDSLCPIEEADGAGEVLAGCEPISEQNLQPACNAVMVPFTHGSAVRCHAVFDI